MGDPSLFLRGLVLPAPVRALVFFLSPETSQRQLRGPPSKLLAHPGPFGSQETPGLHSCVPLGPDLAWREGAGPAQVCGSGRALLWALRGPRQSSDERRQEETVHALWQLRGWKHAGTAPALREPQPLPSGNPSRVGGTELLPLVASAPKEVGHRDGNGVKTKVQINKRK